MIVGDFDNDGFNDLALANTDKGIYLLVGVRTRALGTRHPLRYSRHDGRSAMRKYPMYWVVFWVFAALVPRYATAEGRDLLERCRAGVPGALSGGGAEQVKWREAFPRPRDSCRIFGGKAVNASRLKDLTKRLRKSATMRRRARQAMARTQHYGQPGPYRAVIGIPCARSLAVGGREIVVLKVTTTICRLDVCPQQAGWEDVAVQAGNAPPRIGFRLTSDDSISSNRVYAFARGRGIDLLVRRSRRAGNRVTLRYEYWKMAVTGRAYLAQSMVDRKADQRDTKHTPNYRHRWLAIKEYVSRSPHGLRLLQCTLFKHGDHAATAYEISSKGFRLRHKTTAPNPRP